MPKVTAIRQQVKRADRYSVFVDEKYAFSLSEAALLESRLTSGQELDKEQVAAYKELSAEDKLYNRTLRWVALRPRSAWEVRDYLARHDSPAPLSEQIANKLADLGFIDDAKFAEAFVHDRRLLRSASVRKITLELRRKRVADDIITRALAADETDETALLREVIAKKRRQSKYAQDTTKLMQFLARQGFSYGDIKTALQHEDSDT